MDHSLTPSRSVATRWVPPKYCTPYSAQYVVAQCPLSSFSLTQHAPSITGITGYRISACLCPPLFLQSTVPRTGCKTVRSNVALLARPRIHTYSTVRRAVRSTPHPVRIAVGPNMGCDRSSSKKADSPRTGNPVQSTVLVTTEKNKGNEPEEENQQRTATP